MWVKLHCVAFLFSDAYYKWLDLICVVCRTRLTNQNRYEFRFLLFSFAEIIDIG